MIDMKEKYQIFARKYRPQIFSDVVSQKAIVTTLKNSLKLDKTSQAYLFAGTRGVGKTTLTRLLAKALNCKNLTSSQEPCNECQSCKEISSSCSLDVIEIDGASNRGIDDIRQINDTIGYAPSSGRYKIYIIDEVHMLTKEAFNALLKTLEEPPPTAKFFFATTEPHKVLPTIISRCQRFDLKPISQNLIVNKLKNIAKDQTREISDDALELISKFSDGSLRDAESMLDQILCYNEEKINIETINQIFGLISHDYLYKLDKAVEKIDIETAFIITETLYKEGKDFTFFIEELIEHYRKILLLILKKDSDQLPIKSNKNLCLETANFYSLEQCFYILDLLLKSFLEIQKTPSKRCFLEMILIKIIRSKNIVPLQVLVQRLSKLESKSTKEPIKENIEEKTQLEVVPFDLCDPKVEQHDITKKTKKSQSHYDTLINFSAVEMDGIIKKE